MSVALPIGAATICVVFALVLGVKSMGRSLSLTPLALFCILSVLFVNAGFEIQFALNADEPWALNALVSVTLGLLVTALGGFAAARMLNGSRRWRDLSARLVDADLHYGTAVVTSGLIFCVVAFYFALLGFVPLLAGLHALLTHGFSAGLVNEFRLRRDVYAGQGAHYIPMQGLLEAIRYFGLPMVAIWFIHYLRRGVHRFLSLVMLATALFMSVLTGQRWPLMFLLIALAVYWSWSQPSKAKLVRGLRAIGVGAILCGLIFTFLLGRTKSRVSSTGGFVSFAASSLGQRILLGYNFVPFRSYAVYPSREGFLNGWSYAQNMLALLPGKYGSFPLTFGQTVMGYGGFTAAPDVYTEAYINFGWPGVVVLSFFWGVFLSLFQVPILATKGLFGLSTAALMATLLGCSAFTGVSFIVGSLIAMSVVAGMAVAVRLLFRARVMRRAASAGEPAA